MRWAQADFHKGMLDALRSVLLHSHSDCEYCEGPRTALVNFLTVPELWDMLKSFWCFYTWEVYMYIDFRSCFCCCVFFRQKECSCCTKLRVLLELVEFRLFFFFCPQRKISHSACNAGCLLTDAISERLLSHSDSAPHGPLHRPHGSVRQ